MQSFFPFQIFPRPQRSERVKPAPQAKAAQLQDQQENPAPKPKAAQLQGDQTNLAGQPKQLTDSFQATPLDSPLSAQEEVYLAALQVRINELNAQRTKLEDKLKRIKAKYAEIELEIKAVAKERDRLWGKVGF